MLHKKYKVGIYMEGHIYSEYGKMGMGSLRYLENEIVCVIDSEYHGTNINNHHSSLKSVPIVKNLDLAIDLGMEVLILGIAPSGGKIPSGWIPVIKNALSKKISIVNGLHDLLGQRFKKLIIDKNQWIWDVRVPKFEPQIATGKAANLNNTRLLMVGTDMACGKMTTALEIYSIARKKTLIVGFWQQVKLGLQLQETVYHLTHLKLIMLAVLLNKKFLKIPIRI